VIFADTHAHLDDPRFDADREEVLRRSSAAAVRYVITVGTDLVSSRAAVALAQQHALTPPQVGLDTDAGGSQSPAAVGAFGADGATVAVFAAVGVHPHEAAAVGPDTLDELRRYARTDRVVAIGETGLDFYRNLSPQNRQRDAFIAQLELAQQVNKPVIIHDRDAHAETMTILRDRGRHWQGVLHCFSGDREMALEAIQMGFYISFAGPVTFQNARRLHELAGELPLERLVVETDCPYLAPHPHRGERNEPAYVRWVAAKIAALRDMSVERVAEVTTENARQLFGLPTCS